MSGHSKWSTIKRQKGANDAKRGQTFTKLANIITIAAKLGGSGDAESNPRLRVALEAAREVNMPKENIARAVDRGLGKLPGQTIEEVIYEGFGPARVAYYIEAATDNKLRTLSEIRNMFDRAGGSLGSAGSSSYLFNKVGEITIDLGSKSLEDAELELIDLGVEDIENFDHKLLVRVDPTEVYSKKTEIEALGYTVESAEINFNPNQVVSITDPEQIKKVLDFTSRIEDHDDIQKVYANFDIPEELLKDY